MDSICRQIVSNMLSEDFAYYRRRVCSTWNAFSREQISRTRLLWLLALFYMFVVVVCRYTFLLTFLFLFTHYTVPRYYRRHHQRWPTSGGSVTDDDTSHCCQLINIKAINYNSDREPARRSLVIWSNAMCSTCGPQRVCRKWLVYSRPQHSKETLSESHINPFHSRRW